MRRYLCLYFPRWPLQCVHRAHPETAGQPVILFERTAHGKRVFLASEQAEELGVRPGMPLVEVMALCPVAHQYETNLAAYTETLKQVALWFLRFSPLVGVEPLGLHAPYPKSLFLDVTGCENLYGGEDRLVQTVLKTCQRNGLKARTAIAPTLGLTWAITHAGENGCILPDLSPAVDLLKDMPIAALRVGPETLEQLQPLGLRTVDDLTQQPRAALPSRFGPDLLQRYDQALGIAPEIMPLIRPAPEYREPCEFEYPIRNWEVLFKVLEELVGKLSRTLQHAERGARQVECWLCHELGPPLQVEVALHSGSASAKHLWQILRTKLEDVFRTPQGRGKRIRRKFSIHEAHRSIDAEEGVCAVALQVLSTEPLRDGQLALFNECRREEVSGGLAMLLDKLVTRLGESAVLRACLADEHVPERAVRVLPLNQTISSVAAADSPARPVTLFPKPVPVQIDDCQHLSGYGTSLVIKTLQGPERIESRWWCDGDTHRDYFLALTHTGEQLWLFRQIQDKQWFVHGVFD